MIGVTFFGLFLTPVFYVLLRRLAGNRPLRQHGRGPSRTSPRGVSLAAGREEASRLIPPPLRFDASLPAGHTSRCFRATPWD